MAPGNHPRTLSRTSMVVGHPGDLPVRRGHLFGSVRLLGWTGVPARRPPGRRQERPCRSLARRPRRTGPALARPGTLEAPRPARRVPDLEPLVSRPGRLDGLAEGLAAFARVQLAEHDSPTVRNLLGRRDIESWSRQVLDARGCAKPIRLSGKATLVDGHGTELDSTDGPIFTPCKNRRATVCESCSAHYAHDTFHLVRAGLSGGKGVPEHVTDHVQVLATLTAPRSARCTPDPSATARSTAAAAAPTTARPTAHSAPRWPRRPTTT